MPYSGASDPKLPANVKKLPVKKRRQWVSVFNSTMADCDGDDCEGKAFRVANGVLKRGRKDMSDVPVRCECEEWLDIPFGTKDFTCQKCARGLSLRWPAEETEEKCYPTEVAYYRPYGGATSFAEIDKWQETQEVSSGISNIKYQFDSIYENISANTDIDSGERIAAIEAASKEMVRRMQDPQEYGVREKIKSWLFGEKKDTPAQEPSSQKDSETLFLVTKDIAGGWRWLAVFSNKFKDREGEIFPEDAHKEYELWVDQTQNYPELRLWHVPGSGAGKSDWVSYADGFQLASGYFYKGYEDVAEKLSEMKDLGVSHGFAYDSKHLTSEGVYLKYRTFEISPLPAEKAANAWTAFTPELLKKEVEMGLSKEKRSFLVEALGEGRVASLEEKLPEITKELEEAGVGWKDLAEAMANADPDPDSELKDNSDGDPDPNDGDGDGEEENATAAGVDVKELKSSIKAIFDEAIKPVNEAIAALKEDMAALQSDDDEKIAARVGSRTNTSELARAKRPTDSEDNLVDPDKAKSLEHAEDKDREEPAGLAAARAIVDELMLGKRS